MLVRWNWRDLDRDFATLFEHGFGLRPHATNGDAEKPITWAPAVDVHEDASNLVLFADLPGVEEKDVSISIDKNVLTLRGERRLETAGEAQRVERVQGTFSRSFTLPPTVDAERITATLRAGVLSVTLPKKTEAQPRQIKVSTAS